MILHAALRLIDTDGLDAMSMRRLAAELQVTPRALYHYVDDKDDLLQRVSDAVLSELRPPPQRTAHWTAKVTWTLAELRHVLAIPGTGTVAHLEQNVGAAGLELSVREVDALNVR